MNSYLYILLRQEIQKSVKINNQFATDIYFRFNMPITENDHFCNMLL